MQEWMKVGPYRLPVVLLTPLFDSLFLQTEILIKNSWHSYKYKNLQQQLPDDS